MAALPPPKRMSACVEAQWKFQGSEKITISLNIHSIDWDIFKADKRASSKGGWIITVHHNDHQLPGQVFIGTEADFVITAEEAAIVQYYEVRIAEASNKKVLGTFRVHLAFEGTFVRPLDAIRVHYEAKTTGKLTQSTKFSDWLCGGYRHLFSDINPNPLRLSGSTIDIFNRGGNGDNSNEYLIQPKQETEEIVLFFKNGVLLTPSDRRGALILTNLRLIFIPNFVDIKHLIETTLGDEEERDVDYVANALRAKGMDLDMSELQEFLKTVDTNGDGKVCREELSTFIVANLDKDKFNGFRIPINQIGNIKLPKSGDKKAAATNNGDDDDDEEGTKPTLIKFEEGDIEVKMTKFQRRYTSKYPMGGLKNTYYTISVCIIGHETGWTVDKRYSEFVALREALVTTSSVTALEDLPELTKPKEKFSSSRDSRRFIDVGLFLDALLLHESTRTPVLAEFLQATEQLIQLQNHRMEKDEEEKTAMMSPDRQVAMALLADINKSTFNSNIKSGFRIRVIAKTGFQPSFIIPDDENGVSAAQWSTAVKKEVVWLRSEADSPLHFPFASLMNNNSTNPNKPKSPRIPFGQQLMREEYIRFGIDTTSDFLDDTPSKWRIVDNTKYNICETYPSIFVVPGHADDSMVTECAKQRSKRRLPGLTWVHPMNGTPLFRSAQPLAGLKGGMNETKMKWDMLIAIRDMVPGSSLTVIDARPKLNAQANALAGKGFEDINDMPGLASIDFMDIGNIHTMRNSLALLSVACLTEKNDFYELLATSKWLVHVKMTLRGAKILAHAVDSGSPVLVHCSDGWDRTSQLSALGQILLDPYYRTFNGFARLVEKDFCSFGHMFGRRSDYKSSEYSPIFLQFIDCVWQIQQQFPSSFEFTEQYLIAVIDGFYSGWSTTFLGDCERDRDVLRHRFPDGVSLWDLLDHEELRNTSYVPPTTKVDVLTPKVAMQAIKFWSGLYLRNSSVC